mmetsp:Transcript_62954/g.187651  ORF Transcript_62954/g.187651 Transcript_62954/m.187651 type:complete len:243 (-) Transcript_62954:52-780(-)
MYVLATKAASPNSVSTFTTSWNPLVRAIVSGVLSLSSWAEQFAPKATRTAQSMASFDFALTIRGVHPAASTVSTSARASSTAATPQMLDCRRSEPFVALTTRAISTDRPVSSTALTSARLLMRRRASSKSFDARACKMGVCPLMSAALGSAWASRSRWQTADFLAQTAASRAVWPCSLWRCTCSAPPLWPSSQSTAAVWPEGATTCRTEAPRESLALMSALYRRSSSAVATKPWASARISGV